MTGRRWQRGAGALLAAALAATLISGCATEISGNAVSRSGAAGSNQSPPSGRPASPSQAQASAADLLGQLATLDPCSLTDVGAFGDYGGAQFGEPDSLDDCLVKVKGSGQEPVDLYIGSLDRAAETPDIAGKPTTDLPGGFKVIDHLTDSSFCEQLLLFSDGITLSVNASQYESQEPKLCDIVKTAMSEVVKVVLGGQVRHREFADNSLGTIDPCGLVPGETLAAVPGLGTVAPKSYPAAHSCAWTAVDNSVRLRLMFIAGAPPKPAAQGSTTSDIAGRQTVLSPTPDAGNYAFCGQQTGHIPFAGEGQAGLVEIAAVFVRMEKGKIDPACQAATGVAEAVWPKLPPA